MTITKVAETVPLADEIQRRRLKFADVVDGQYEMLSGDEHNTIVAALTAAADVPEQEHIPQKPGQKPDLLPSGNTAAEVGPTEVEALEEHQAMLRAHTEIEEATIERCAGELDRLRQHEFGGDDQFAIGFNEAINQAQFRIRALKDQAVK